HRGQEQPARRQRPLRRLVHVTARVPRQHALRHVLGQWIHGTAPRSVGVPAPMTRTGPRTWGRIAALVAAALVGASTVVVVSQVTRPNPVAPPLTSIDIGFAQD